MKAAVLNEHRGFFRVPLKPTLLATLYSFATFTNTFKAPFSSTSSRIISW